MKHHHTVYRVVDGSQLSTITFRQWKRIGGCDLSDYASRRVTHILGEPPVVWQDRMVSVVQRACIVAGREIARYARVHMNMPIGNTQVEYRDGVRVVDDRVCSAIA